MVHPSKEVGEGLKSNNEGILNFRYTKPFSGTSNKILFHSKVVLYFFPFKTACFQEKKKKKNAEAFHEIIFTSIKKIMERNEVQ